MNPRTAITVDGDDAILGDEDVVLDGPQTARLHEFSVSATEVFVGDPVTVRWNTESASRVVLETSIPWNGSRWGEAVEPVGSRTFTATRSGVAFVDLLLDGGAFRRNLNVNVRQR